MIVSDKEWEQQRQALADLTSALVAVTARCDSLAETACTLFDAVAFGTLGATLIGTHFPMRDNFAAEAFEAVLQNAWLLMAGYDYSTREWSAGTALCADALRDALANPVVAAMLDAWATKEG